MKDCALPEFDDDENVTLGFSLTSLTRTREPFEGVLAGNETVRSYVGVKFAGMIFEGSSEADFRLSMRLVAAIFGSVFLYWLKGLIDV